MENILNSILLFVITGLLGSIGIGMRRMFKRHLNKLDIIGFKATSIDYGCEETLGQNYKDKRNEKWADLIEEDELKNKER